MSDKSYVVKGWLRCQQELMYKINYKKERCFRKEIERDIIEEFYRHYYKISNLTREKYKVVRRVKKYLFNYESEELRASIEILKELEEIMKNSNITG